MLQNLTKMTKPKSTARSTWVGRLSKVPWIPPTPPWTISYYLVVFLNVIFYFITVTEPKNIFNSSNIKLITPISDANKSIFAQSYQLRSSTFIVQPG
jgi:hypothetical protein